MKNKKSKCIAIIFLLLPLISLPPVLAQASDSSSKWDQPFDQPMYLLHTNGGKYYDSNWTDSGTLIDKRWILYPSNNGFIDMPSGSEGLIVRYSIDQQMGPYDTPRKVCSVAEAEGIYPYIFPNDNNNPVLFCKDMPAQPEKPNQPDSGVGSTGDLAVQTTAGTTEIKKPGSKMTLSPKDKIKLGANCKEFVLLVRGSMGNDQNFVGAILRLAYIRSGGLMVLPMHALFDLMSCVYTCARLYDENQGRLAKSASDSSPLLGSSMDQSDSPAQIELGLESGPFLAEVVNDKVSLILKTDTATVTSSGKNTFGVAYVPSIGTTFVAAYQGSVSIQPANSNLAPFTLDAGQIVDVSSEEIGPVTPLSQVSGGTEDSTHVSPDGRDIYGPAGGAGNAAGQTGATSGVPQGGCYTDPSTGQMICMDRISDFFNPEGGNQEQGGCYADPQTGEIICVDAFGEITNPSSSMGTAYTMKPDAGSSVPPSLQECETYTSEICGTWTRMGDQFNAQWESGASATLNVERWDNGAVVLTRHDTVGSSAGLTARYEGRCTGNHVEGTVTWTWNGSTWSGTWSANW
jgi:hypothetical protein